MIYIKPSPLLTTEKREILYDAASVILNELMGRKRSRVLVNISVKGKGLERGVDGYCLCTEEYDNGKPKEIDVDIRGDKGIDFAIKCLAHELVHVWQMCTGRIDEEVYHKSKDHYNSPWEREARELEEPLYNLYVKNS
jgi:hypothetical protein